MLIKYLKNSLGDYNKIWLVAYVLTLFIPLGLIFSRGFADFSCSMVGVLFLLNSYKTENWKWATDFPVKIAIIAWLWMMFVVTPLAINSIDSASIALPWIRYIIFFAALKNWVLTNRKHIEFLGKFLAAILAITIIDAIWQYIFGISLSGNMRDMNGRLTGPLDNVKVGIFIAKILIPTSAVCLFSAATGRKHIFTAIILIIMFAGVTTIMLSGERTAFVSSIIALFFAALLLTVAEKNLRLFISSVIIALTLSSIFLFKTQEWVQNRSSSFFHTVINYPQTEYGQLNKAGVIIGTENFITGAGLRSFRELCRKLYNQDIITTENIHPHNIYIEWFAETGIIGFLLFSTIVISLFAISVKNFTILRNEDRILCALVIASLLVNFFPFMPTQSQFSNWPAVLLWYSVSVAISSFNMLKKSSNNFSTANKVVN